MAQSRTGNLATITQFRAARTCHSSGYWHSACAGIRGLFYLFGFKWWRNRFIGEATYRLRCVAIIVLNSFTTLDFSKWFHRFILGILIWTGIHGKRGIAFIPRHGRYDAQRARFIPVLVCLHHDWIIDTRHALPHDAQTFLCLLSPTSSEKNALSMSGHFDN